MSDVALDRFAYDTNGSPFPQETKVELREFMDCDDEGRLTVSGTGFRLFGTLRLTSCTSSLAQFSGFLQMYHLQADNDLDETWK